MVSLRRAAVGIPFGAALAASSVASGQLLDPGFNEFGTFWGNFGTTDFNAFFGDNPHASFFADNPANGGGVFQQGIAAQEGGVYTFTLEDVRIEENFNANFSFGLEFYEADDATLISAVFEAIDTNDPDDGLVTGDNLSFSIEADSVDGAAFVRPIIVFDSPAPSSSNQANAFVFTTSLSFVPGPSGAAALLGGSMLVARRRR